MPCEVVNDSSRSSGDLDDDDSSGSDTSLTPISPRPVSSSSQTMSDEDTTNYAALTALALHLDRHNLNSAEEDELLDQFMNNDDDAVPPEVVEDELTVTSNDSAIASNRNISVRFSNGAVLKNVVCPFDDRVHYQECNNLGLRQMSPSQLANDGSVFSPEFAELSFICRVLSVALNQDTPLLERFKFLCIVSSNLDEQFCKRLGNIVNINPEDLELFTHTTRQQVRPKNHYEEKLTTAIRTIVDCQYRCLENDVLPKLRKHGIELLSCSALSEEERKHTSQYFERYIRPLITPMIYDSMHPFPLLFSHAIYVVAHVSKPSWSIKSYMLLRVPKDKRLVPVGGSDFRYVRSEDLIAHNLKSVCNGFIIHDIFTIRVTRNIKLDINDTAFGETRFGLDYIVNECHRRQGAPATRLEVPSNISEEAERLLIEKLGLHSADVYKISSDILDLGSLFSLSTRVPAPSLCETLTEPCVPGPFKGLFERVQTRPEAIFQVLRKRDVLVEYPHESFQHSMTLFLQAAARDPLVRCVKTVLYRSGSKSPVVGALIRAAKNGKEVTVLVELKASFDEVTNAGYAQELKLAGANLIYGSTGLKVHSKATLVVREEEDGLEYYSNISTGNYNASTAKMYTDMGLFTRRRDIGEDLSNVFHSLTSLSEPKEYKSLLVAPGCMLPKFIGLIRNEANNAREGKPARIVAQVNGLTDKTIVKELYQASEAGVRIDLIVRGQCRLIPEIPGKSDNIRVFSWIGQVLQHRRIFYFLNGGDGNEKFFMGSADWRTRNLNDRVEVVVPIHISNRGICKRLAKALSIVNDKSRTWRMSWDGRYYLGIPISNQPANVVSMNSKSGAPTDTPSSFIPEREYEAFPTDVTPLPGFPKTKKKKNPLYEINIRGENTWVNKKSCGAVPIRYQENDDGVLTNIEVLMVAREKESTDEDPWSVPKGGQKASESLIEGSFRVAREKSGVLRSLEVENIGWLLREKKNKKIGVHTLVIEVLELGKIPDSNDRTAEWRPVKVAIEEAHKSGNDFTQEALRRAVEALKRKYEISRQTIGTEFSISAASNRSGISSPSPSSPVINSTPGPTANSNSSRQLEDE